MSKRLERATALLHQEISKQLIGLIADKRYGLVTVSQIELSPDLGKAAVWVSLLANEFPADAVIAHLNNQAGELQHNLGKVLYWKRTPKLLFRHDVSGNYAERIEQALDEITDGSDNDELDE